jgi:pyruvate dehydrogenase (quinone)/pyruvate oxidase
MLMAEFSTCVKYRLPVKVIIIKNNELGQIKWEQLVFLGNPEYGVELEPIDHVKFAQACGGRGFRIDHPAHCADILEQAMALPGPVIVEAVVDPNEPPMPPKIRPEQAIHFAEALVRGEPNGERIAMTVLRDRVRELI